MPKKQNEILSSPKIWYEIIKGYNEKEKLPLDKLLAIFSEEVNRIVQKNIDPEVNIVFELNEEAQEIHIYNTEALVISDEEWDTYTENEKIALGIFNIPLSLAKKVQKGANVNDSIKIEIDLLNLTRSTDPAVQRTPKSIESSILQAIKKLQKSIVYDKYINRIGETVKVSFVSKNSRGSWNVQLVEDGTIAHLPASFISAKRNINPGSYGDVVIESVEEDTKLSQITVSLDSPKIIEKILTTNIPEIANGLIEIVRIQRVPGERTKVVFKPTASNEDIDVYGSIMGVNSSRINTIVNELNQGIDQKVSEKLDVIVYSDDKNEFIKRCMLPGQVVDIVPNPKNENSYYVITTNSGLSAAIGRKGSNTLLASKISGFNLNVITIEEAEKMNIAFNRNKIAEVEQAIISSKRYHQTKRNTYKQEPRRSGRLSDLKLNLEGFEKDILAFKEQEQNFFDTNTSENMEFDELIQQYNEEMAKEQDLEADNDTNFDAEKVNSNEQKQSLSDYKKAKEVAKNFKVDNDLSSFGLDEDIDLSDIDEEDWE
ncbi:transcription termination/antitermination protein NusA [Mycoplasmopsis primatum]|uniref:transcription termination/antitermination protein NusA n=1 Tax=Mycoplasmopsis primatum TaxID=55604 RepID=UPI000495BB8C|nr:transcription termination/antitermination protein NusA [Mycoplasmopsis primatum]